MVICLEGGANDLHMAWLMPLPGILEKEAVKGVFMEVMNSNLVIVCDINIVLCCCYCSSGPLLLMFAAE